MRMIASDDAAQTLANTANVVSAYTTEANTTHTYEFVRAASRIRTGGYAMAASNDAKGYRDALAMTRNTVYASHITSHIATLADTLSIYNGRGGMSGYTTQVYKDLAATLLENERQALIEQLPTWKNNNSERVELYRQLFNPKA